MALNGTVPPVWGKVHPIYSLLPARCRTPVWVKPLRRGLQASENFRGVDPEKDSATLTSFHCVALGNVYRFLAERSFQKKQWDTHLLCSIRSASQPLHCEASQAYGVHHGSRYAFTEPKNVVHVQRPSMYICRKLNSGLKNNSPNVGFICTTITPPGSPSFIYDGAHQPSSKSSSGLPTPGGALQPW